MMRRLRKTPNFKKEDKDASTSCTLDSSADEADDNPPPIRWERTPSGKIHPEERKIMMKESPNPAAFCSHFLINRERIRHGRDPLIRCRHLDAIAKRHAQEMAEDLTLREHPICSATMAENVHRGPSIRTIHSMIMGGVSDLERDNVLSERFSRFGMGTATGEDGMIYMSQVFQASAAKRRPTF